MMTRVGRKMTKRAWKWGLKRRKRRRRDGDGGEEGVVEFGGNDDDELVDLSNHLEVENKGGRGREGTKKEKLVNSFTVGIKLRVIAKGKLNAMETGKGK
jgi:hypothetical protein